MVTIYYLGDPKYKGENEFNIFVRNMNTGSPKKILEVGVARSNDNIPTHHENMFTNVESYIKTDFVDDGIDVDIVSDIHRLEDTFDAGIFDGLVARSVYEHVEKPWLASASINKVLKIGGLVHVDTHFTFPIHGYPNDYFRFTTDGLVSLFDESFGFRVMACDYDWPISLVFKDNQNPVSVWDEYAATAKNFLHVGIVAEKIKDI